MKVGYRIMMTELCKVPHFIEIKPGCTDGMCYAPYLVEEPVYYTMEEAEEKLAEYRSTATGSVTDRFGNKYKGVREFYIEKIKLVGEYDRKSASYGAVKYAEFMTYENGVPDFVPEPPPVIKWCKRKNYDGPAENCIRYKRKTKTGEKIYTPKPKKEKTK